MDRRSWRVGKRLVRSLRNSPQGPRGPEEGSGKQPILGTNSGMTIDFCVFLFLWKSFESYQ